MDAFGALKLGRSLSQSTYDDASKLHSMLGDILEVKANIAGWALNTMLLGVVGMFVTAIFYPGFIFWRSLPAFPHAPTIVMLLITTYSGFFWLVGFLIGYRRHASDLRLLYGEFRLCFHYDPDEQSRNFFSALRVIHEIKFNLYVKAPRDIRRAFQKWLKQQPADPS